jgi:HPt (histidine-containing phosphotransfer) domain-containing protein
MWLRPWSRARRRERSVASSTAQQPSSGKRRRLLLPLVIIFGAIISLQLASLKVRSWTSSSEHSDRMRLAAAATQRLLVDQYERCSYLAAVGLQTENWQLVTEQRLKANALAEAFDQTNTALTHGGTVTLGGERIEVAELHGEELGSLALEASRLWREATTSQIRMLRSGNNGLKDNRDLEQFRGHAAALIGVLEQLHAKLASETGLRQRRTELVETLLPLASALLIVMLAAFVYLRILRPLDVTTRDLEVRTRELDTSNQDLRDKADAISTLLTKEQAANAAIQRLLNSVDQGFVTLDRSGALMSGRSAVFDRWFGAPDDGTHFADCLTQLSPDTGALFRLAWSQIEDDVLPLELLIAQLPTTTRSSDRHFRIDYTPELDGAGRLVNVFVVMSDVTAEIERERAEAQQRDLLSLMGRFASDRGGFRKFLHEADALVQSISAPGLGLTELTRAVHTLKGACALFDAQMVALHCHEFEDRLADLRALPSEGERRSFASVWFSLRQRIGVFLDDDEVITIERAELERLRQLSHTMSAAELVELLATWMWEPAAVRMSRLGAQARALATKLGKGRLDVVIDGGGLRFQPEHWDSFWTSLAHLVSNSVDHGIESPDTRAGLGKPEHGRVTLRSFLEGERVIVEFSDDGRGIDWDAVAHKATQHGLKTSTETSLIRALLSDGISTRNEVTLHSGRGVGLAAVRAACESLGGVVAIESEPQRGTRFRFTLPAKGVACAITPGAVSDALEARLVG